MLDIKTVGKSNLQLLIDLIGNGFHPDSKISDYVKADGSMLFDDAMCTYYQGMLDTAWEAFGDDIYSESITIMEAKDDSDNPINYEWDTVDKYGDSEVLKL